MKRCACGNGCENCQAEWADLEMKLNDLKDQLKGKAHEFKQSDKKNGILAKEVDNLQRRVTKLQEDLQKARINIGEKDEAIKKAITVIEKLQKDIESLMSPANKFAAFSKSLGKNKKGAEKAEVIYGGEISIVGVLEGINLSGVKFGQKVIVDRSVNAIMEVREEMFSETGEECGFMRVLDEQKRLVMISTKMDERRVVYAIYGLDLASLKESDKLLVNTKAGLLLAKLPRVEAEETVLEEIPDVTFADIGGLDKEVGEIIDELISPIVHPKSFAMMKCKRAKGCLLHGPPGNGKSMIGKATANFLMTKLSELYGREVKGSFLLVNGPELLNMYVGNTEAAIRAMFNKAKGKSKEGYVVVLFLDELDALLGRRGSGVSSDTEKTIVPQFTTLMDGIEKDGMENVIIMGATNRPDRLDDAITRPGRLSLKIYIPRPNEEAARKILSLNITKDLPFDERYYADELVWHDYFAPRSEWEDEEGKRTTAKLSKDPENIVKYVIDRMIARIYYSNPEPIIFTTGSKKERVAVDNRFLKVYFTDGTTEVRYFKDFLSGALLVDAVDRGKKKAIKENPENPKLRVRHLLEAIEVSFKEIASMPNTLNSEDMIQILGSSNKKVHNVEIIQKEYSLKGDSVNSLNDENSMV